MSGRAASTRFPRRLGKGMIVAAWIGVAALLTVLFDGYLERQSNPNASPQTRAEAGAREVVLERNRQGHYVATGRINGTRARFLLDTGATDVAVPGALARKLDLERGRAVRARTANGDVVAYATLLREVALGDIVLRQVRASIIPQMPGEEVLLGMAFLKHLELIQRGSELTLRQYL